MARKPHELDRWIYLAAELSRSPKLDLDVRDRMARNAAMLVRIKVWRRRQLAVAMR